MPPHRYETLPTLQRSQLTQGASNLWNEVLNSFKIVSYHLLLMNGTNWILTLEMLTLIRYFVRIFNSFYKTY